MIVWRRGLAIGGILLLAAGARLWALTEYPPGLYPDQAANGEDALDILSGNLQVFSLRNNGRESLFFYVVALTVGIFGVGTWPLFLASALCGIATVAATYAAGVRLFGKAAAMLAALFLATNPWHVTLSRTGFRAITVPLFIALTLWGLARVFQAATPRARWTSAILAGLAAGLGFYTYTAYRAFLVFLMLAGAIVIVRLFLQQSVRDRAQPALLPLAIAGVTAFAVALPLLWFFAAHPGFSFVRAQHVSIFNPDLNNGDPKATLLRMTGRTLRAFVWDGDGNPRHNVPRPRIPYTPGGIHHYHGGGTPFLSFVPALLGLVGVLVALRRAPWLILLFLTMLLPAVTTAEGIPHGLRTVGAIPAHVFLAGLGGQWLWTRVRRLPWGSVRLATPVIAALALIFTALSNLGWYFSVARNSPLAHYEYRADLTEVSIFLNAAARGNSEAPVPYLVLDRFSEQTVHFLTTPTGRRYRLLDPKTSAKTRLKRGEQILFVQSTLFDAQRYRRVFPRIRVIDERTNRFGETTMLVLAP
ncbi:MAG: glycosyl transferase family protein [Parcubacteria group bacterium Gr01-1014_38]|nr:MAG: glycosyl transferase family protein [Parcubacteria group bacterium Gr01-1014_38]